MLRDFQAVPYVPVLSVRPAEMNALLELPEKDKDALLPFILLRAWVGSNDLENSLLKVAEVYGDRPWIADIDPNYGAKDKPRPVHRSLDALKDSSNGYENWCEFLRGVPHAIPCLQIEDLGQLARQLTALAALDRGIALRIPMDLHPDIDAILGVLTATRGLRPLVVLDFGQENRDLLTRAAAAIGIVRKIHNEIPDASTVACATTFPDSFVNVPSQTIFERQFYNAVAQECEGVSLIYGDRGSARAKPLGGGGGAPASRIDYPLSEEWKFFREDAPPPHGYTAAARALIKEKRIWNKNLHLWGTNQIQLTEKDDDFGIRSPVRATAVRINIHLHMQLHYGDTEAALTDTDDDWVD